MDLLLAAVHADDAVASLVEPACPEHASALRVGNEPGVEAFPEQRPSHDAAASGTRNLAGGTSRALPIAARSSVLNATAPLRRRLRYGSDQPSCSHKLVRDRFRRPSHARTSAAISSRAMRGKLSLAESLRKRYLPLPTKNLYGGRMDVTPAMVTQETVAAEVRAWRLRGLAEDTTIYARRCAIARLGDWLKCYHEEVMPIAASNCPRTRLQVRDVPSGTLVDVPRPGTAMNLTGAGPGHFRSIEDATAPICSPGAPRSPSPRGSRFDRAFAVWRVL